MCIANAQTQAAIDNPNAPRQQRVAATLFQNFNSTWKSLNNIAKTPPSPTTATFGAPSKK